MKRKKKRHISVSVTSRHIRKQSIIISRLAQHIYRRRAGRTRRKAARQACCATSQHSLEKKEEAERKEEQRRRRLASWRRQKRAARADSNALRNNCNEAKRQNGMARTSVDEEEGRPVVIPWDIRGWGVVAYIKTGHQ